MASFPWQDPVARGVLDRMSDRFLALDAEDTILFANAPLREGGAELAGRSYWDVWPHLRGSEVERAYRRARTSGEPVSFEYLHPTGAWLDVVAHPDGDRLHVYFRNVSRERLRAEAAALAQSNRELEQLIESAGDALYTMDGDWRIEHFNAKAEAMFERSRESVVGRTFQEAFPRSWNTEFSHRYERTLATGEPQAFEAFSPTLGRWIDARASRYGNGLVISLRDVTDSRHRVTMLESTIRVGRVLASELSAQGVVQALTDATTEAVGAQFGSFFYNTATETPDRFGLYVLSGVPREAFAAYPFVRATPLFAPTFEGCGTVLSHDVTQDSRYGALSDGQGIPTGHLAVRSYLAVSVPSRSGEILGGLLFGHADAGRFTEEHARLVEAFAAQAAVAYENALLVERLERAKDELETRVKERTAELTAANEALQGFTYHVSHDLRTPLRAIVSTSRMIQADHANLLPPEASDLLDRQAEAGRKLGTLIDDLLQLSRLSREELARQPLDLSALVCETWPEALAGHSHSDVVLIVEEGLQARADPRLLRLAVHNLLENAIKYSPGGGTVRVGQQDSAFFVSDQGIGFEPRYAERIFEPFQRLHRDDAFKGTGVGLANVKQVIDRHGGRIWAEGRPSEGATFWFQLP